MVGSILWNCWASLIGFSIYFFITFQSFKTPTTILSSSFIVALVVFLIAFLVRFVIAFVFFSPLSEETHAEGELAMNNEQVKEQQTGQTNNNIEENAEEVAKVVQSMMLEDIK
ncbi:hypothetical protein MKZ08_16810 [Viridibacillus sp. FSL R5-0477]|uniref:Uncharacterized protein n=1 Tax=Viridibacillus arenosi FSL R5-213 TaxID=1227360 RepID=W4F1D2_9BACL|nr:MULTISPECIES: hypothetical protein [Viridibacillus]ETT85881.1 hypothetical protein C176_10632 [Viridibacillus arenosi FSL R5-213]OMC82871.1 hypothetical protein BK130_08990 [Viridibacillus sp. FSL H8-0123]OMC88790.1 hypothetical protein BK128_02295 [Viridibacillus sp. FSL H7-0596]OMC93418.1 hypothetical protein BK137_02570 [Viridibacillus arenosi]